MNNGDIVNLVNTVINRDLNGLSIKTSEFQTLINAQSKLLFAEKLGIPNEYRPNLPVGRMGAGVSRKISEELRPFLRTETVSVISGSLDLSSKDIGYLLSIDPTTISGRGIDILEPDELADRLGSAVVAPTLDDPAAKWISETSLLVYPTTVTSVVVSYYTNPTDAVVVFDTNPTTLLQSYNTSSSTETGWLSEQLTEIAYRILRDAGVNLEKQDAFAYGQNVTQNE